MQLRKSHLSSPFAPSISRLDLFCDGNLVRDQSRHFKNEVQLLAKIAAYTTTTSQRPIQLGPLRLFATQRVPASAPRQRMQISKRALFIDNKFEAIYSARNFRVQIVGAHAPAIVRCRTQCALVCTREPRKPETNLAKHLRVFHNLYEARNTARLHLFFSILRRSILKIH